MTTLVESDLRRDEALQPRIEYLRLHGVGKWVMDGNGAWVLRPYTLVRTNGRLSEIPASETRAALSPTNTQADE